LNSKFDQNVKEKSILIKRPRFKYAQTSRAFILKIRFYIKHVGFFMCSVTSGVEMVVVVVAVVFPAPLCSVLMPCHG